MDTSMLKTQFFHYVIIMLQRSAILRRSSCYALMLYVMLHVMLQRSAILTEDLHVFPSPSKQICDSVCLDNAVAMKFNKFLSARQSCSDVQVNRRFRDRLRLHHQDSGIHFFLQWLDSP
jgi:hypothetical protein